VSVPSIDARAQEVLDFWFGAPGSVEYGHARRFWWKKKRAFDAMLVERFGSLLEDALAGGLADWERGSLGTLALILLLDQFARNCYRGTPRAFAGDARALSLARRLVEEGDDLLLPTPYHRAFVYMPFEHDESLESQREAVRLFSLLKEQTGVDDMLAYAVRHADVIERFGRFPHRNRVLGRVATREEEMWLDQNGGF
jgi:uncharacterized protein (DUF924 family)